MYITYHFKVKLNTALTGIKFLNYDWEVLSRDGRWREQVMNLVSFSCMQIQLYVDDTVMMVEQEVYHLE